jgi:hypothetical protein
MFLTVLIASLIIVALAFLGLGLSIFFRKKGKFPDHEVGTNHNMKKMGITCVKQDELKAWGKDNKKGGNEGTSSQSSLRDCGLGCSCAAEDS